MHHHQWLLTGPTGAAAQLGIAVASTGAAKKLGAQGAAAGGTAGMPRIADLMHELWTGPCSSGSQHRLEAACAPVST